MSWNDLYESDLRNSSNCCSNLTSFHIQAGCDSTLPDSKSLTWYTCFDSVSTQGPWSEWQYRKTQTCASSNTQSLHFFHGEGLNMDSFSCSRALLTFCHCVPSCCTTCSTEYSVTNVGLWHAAAITACTANLTLFDTFPFIKLVLRKSLSPFTMALSNK